ncbi:hypothetical protein L6164_027536 [Bauhinia variegata]|uniref:Uncharacterized protein n=1 Tax=Bauhinia variegata TaxID=167791 RepID=A0ACB9LV30_BAUVA|nr:hypothetical protein L6164_027536 [Bauhinia variegata]
MQTCSKSWFLPHSLLLISPPYLSASSHHVLEGYQNGVWLCIFAFHADHKPPFCGVPSLLSVTRNSKLRTVPTLFNDLYLINKLDCSSEVEKSKCWAYCTQEEV